MLKKRNEIILIVFIMYFYISLIHEKNLIVLKNGLSLKKSF